VRYTKFVIHNYRAINGPLEIDVEKKTLMPIVGINESGKTTILHALFAFDYFNDKLNDDGRHLKDTSNLYRTSSPPAIVEAAIDISRDELMNAIADCEKSNQALKEEFGSLSKKRGLPNYIGIKRNLSTLKYSVGYEKFCSEAAEDILAKELIKFAPYILFFDDFRDKIEEKIEIVASQEQNPSGWLSIIEQLFKQTDGTLSVFQLPKLEERRRKTVLAKVQRKLNETRALLVLQAALLAGCLGLGVGYGPLVDPDRPMAVVVGMLGVAAMATQNALVRLALPGAPSTAVMTTNTTQLTVDLATLARSQGDPDELARARRRVGVTLPCLLGFLVGCTAGAVLEVRFGLWALALPVVLAALAVPLGELRSED
jgi:hypothetical protein